MLKLVVQCSQGVRMKYATAKPPKRVGTRMGRDKPPLAVLTRQNKRVWQAVTRRQRLVDQRIGQHSSLRFDVLLYKNRLSQE